MGWDNWGWIGGIVILASCEHQFIRVHENLVQHPSTNISISSINFGLTYQSFHPPENKQKSLN